MEITTRLLNCARALTTKYMRNAKVIVRPIIEQTSKHPIIQEIVRRQFHGQKATIASSSKSTSFAYSKKQLPEQKESKLLFEHRKNELLDESRDLNKLCTFVIFSSVCIYSSADFLIHISQTFMKYI
jgi:hypothetical protein